MSLVATFGVATFGDAAFGDLLPGSLAWSVVGATWSFLLALLIGATLWPKLAEAGDEAGDDDRAHGDAHAHASGRALLAWWLLGMVMMGPIILGLSAATLLTSRGLVVTCSALTIACGALSGRRTSLALRAAARALLHEARDASLATRLGMGALAGVLALTTLLACIPTTHFDDLVYHLGLPRQALILGAWPELPRFHHSFMPAAWEAAQTLPLALGGGGGPQLMNAGVLALLAAVTLRIARRAAPAWAAWMATAFILASPVFVGSGALAGNDLVVGLGLLVALETLLDRRAPQDSRTTLIAGLGGGLAAAAKYTGLLGAGVLCASLFLWDAGTLRAKFLRSLAIGALVILAASPWLLRAGILTGNPVYPTAWTILGGETWEAEGSALLTRDSPQGAPATVGARGFVTGVVELARGADSLGDPSGVLPLLMPGLWLVLLILALRREDARRLLIYTILAYVAWSATSLMLRFFLPPLLLLALPLAALLGQVATWRERRGMTGASLVLASLGLLAVAGLAASAADATISRLGPATTWGEALSRTDVVASRIDAARATREIATTLPRDAKLLAIGETRLGLMPRATEISTAIDAPLLGDVLQGCTSVADVDARLSGRATHVLVNYRELERQLRDYGLAERLGAEKLQLMRDWLAQADLLGTWGNTALYGLPSKG